MTLAQRLSEWLGVRPHEVRIVAVSFAGAFLVMSFVVLSRALREAAYLAEFDASTLPYVTGGVVALGFPLAVLFTRMLGRVDPRRAMRVFALTLATAVAAMWPFLGSSPTAVVAFYLITAAGTVLLASGFWLVVSEMLVVREAKRLFGLISAGGTLGMMVTGTAVGVAVQAVEPVYLVPALAVILVAYAGLNEFVPRDRISDGAIGGDLRWTDSIALIFKQPHIRTLAAIVLLAGMIGGLVDFQFKEAAQDVFGSEQELASFFGLFYGFVGGVALAIQLFVTTRIMSRAGVTWSLAVLPLFVVALSAGMLIVPGLVLITGLRGTDSSLRKSLFRSVTEFLWVPVDQDIRRQTKTFVDTTAGNVGDGFAALIVFLIVTLGTLPSRYLSLVVIGAGVIFLGLTRTMGREYLATLRRRLVAGESRELLEQADAGPTIGPVTLHRIDLTRILSTVVLDHDASSSDRDAAEFKPRPKSTYAHPADLQADPQAVLASADDEQIRSVLTSSKPLGADSVPALARLLARDKFRDAAARRLIALGEPAGAGLAEILRDDTADFVVRRRIAGVLGAIPGETTFHALVEALAADRFEVRYRAARSLSRRHADSNAGLEDGVWSAIRSELSRGRAVWELARLLDQTDSDEFVDERAARRGQLSLEHVFRLLSLVLDAEPIHAAWNSIAGDHAEIESLALEYLEQVLPEDVRDRLWPFIGDLSAEQARRSIRPLDDVIEDLMDTGATLFGGDHRAELERYLKRSDQSKHTEATEPTEPAEPTEASEPSDGE